MVERVVSLGKGKESLGQTVKIFGIICKESSAKQHS